MPGLQNRSLDKAVTPHPGMSPAVLRLPGLQNRRPDKAVTPHPGTLPGGAAPAGATEL
ncbi:TPA: hypothetical protein I8287_004911 [Kluyvera intermedia]|nr:hypothetical protein [Kluyvera intermedia]